MCILVVTWLFIYLFILLVFIATQLAHLLGEILDLLVYLLLLLYAEKLNTKYQIGICTYCTCDCA